MCYFTSLHIYLRNEISILHILIKPLFREDPNICKSSRFRLCALLFLKKKGKKGKKELRGQLGKEMEIMSMLVT